MTKISDLAKPECDECGGEGYVSYARGEDAEDLPCEKCFPNTSWEDLLIDPDSEWDDRD